MQDQFMTRTPPRRHRLIAPGCGLLALALVLLPARTGRAATERAPAAVPAKSADTQTEALRLSGISVETFVAVQSRPDESDGSAMGMAVRADTTGKTKSTGFYFRAEGMTEIPLHGSSGDPAFHAEAGFMYKPRVQAGPIGLSLTLSAGPAFGLVRPLRDCTTERCADFDRDNRFVVGFAAGAAADLHIYFVTLSLQVRWRPTLGTQGVYQTVSLGPSLGVHW